MTDDDEHSSLHLLARSEAFPNWGRLLALPHKCKARVKATDSDEHPNLIQSRIEWWP
jgi:hypothetical protein